MFKSFRRSAIICFLLLGFFFKSHVFAVEVYSFVTENCSMTKGLIIGAKEDDLSILTLDGQYKQIKPSEISLIVTYNLLDNPIRNLKLDQESLSKLRHVYVGSKEKPQFTGWPIVFIENLVVFYDINGLTHVLDLQKILKIRPITKEEFTQLNSTSKTLAGRSTELSFDPAHSKCQGLGRSGVQPIRVLADKIRIGDFFSTFVRGFDKIESFEERTYFYPKPFLYDRKTKFGFMSYSTYHEQPMGPGNKVPIYFQWATGTEYRFQSFNVLGKQLTPDTPSLEPTAAFRSELKSHIFHGEFIGNLSALSAGTEYFTPISKEYSDVDPKKKTLADQHARSAMHFNYMAIMGLDYDAFSISYGTFFPIHYFEFGPSFREILGSSPSPLVRFMYTLDHGQLRVLMGWTEYNISNPNDLHLSYSSTDSTAGQFSSLHLLSRYIRAGGHYDISPRVRLRSDVLFVNGDYSETLSSVETTNTMKFQHSTLSGGVQFNFGDYVSVGGFMNILNNKQEYLYSGSRGSHLTQDQVLGGTFEFIF